MAQLRYLDAEGRLKTLDLAAEPCTIGRVAGCQVMFADDMISREHARLDREADGRYRIRDLGSRNKTFVNGQMVSETILAAGDVIRIGDHVFEYVDPRGSGGELTLDFLTPDRKDPPGTEWIKVKAPVTLSMEQIGQLAGLHPGDGFSARLEDVADAALSRLVIDLQADRGLIAVRGEGKREIRPLAHRGLMKPASGAFMPVSETFIHSAVLQSVAGRYPQQPGQIDPKAGYAATAMVAPLVNRGEIVGLVYLDRCTAKQPFSATALQHLLAAGAQVGSAMAEATRRLEDSAVREGAAWLTGVRRAQEAFSSMPRESESFTLAVKCFPGRGRCGDLAHLFHLDDHACCVVVLDAGGQGIVGLAQAAAIHTALRVSLTKVDALDDLGSIFSAINQTLAEAKSRQPVPCVAVGLNLRSGRAVYVNAGASPPLVMSGPGRLVTLDQPSLLLGIDRNYAYETASVDLSTDFRLVCHTDGLTEAINGSQEAWGTQRLHDVLLHKDAFGPPAEIIDKVATAMTAHMAGQPLDDDAIVLVVGTK